MTFAFAQRFPANAQDLVNHISGYLGCKHEIHCILTFNCHIDFYLLRKAAALLLKTEPVLGCRFIENQKAAYWLKRHDLDEIEICTILETDKTNVEMDRFINRSVDSYHDPMLQIKVLRTARQDIVCLKINHACCDAGGLKECVALLAAIYNRLITDGNFRPQINILGRRDNIQVFEQVSLNDVQKTWNSSQPPQANVWSFPAKIDLNLEPQYVIKKLSSEQSHQLQTYGHKKKVTINDLLLTAFYRALFAITEPAVYAPMPISVTLDLRRYVPFRKAEALCNLTGIITPSLARVPGESFPATLTRVAEVMNCLKMYVPGLKWTILTEVYARLGFAAFFNWMCSGESFSSTPILSNIGLVSREIIHFGDVEATDAYMIGPAMSAPASLLAATTYNNILTLSMAYHEPAVTKKQVESFLKLMVSELPI